MRGAFRMLLGLCALAGVLALFGAFQLQQIQSVAQAEPHEITLAELIQKGPGGNVHLQVTSFAFGKPLMDKTSDESIAWVPLYPAGGRTQGRPPALWRVRADEASLPELLQATSSLAVVDPSRMPSKILWEAKAPGRVIEEFPAPPKGQSARILVLAEAQTQLFGWTLEPGQLFSPILRIAAWAVGGVLAVLGIGGLLWLGRAEVVPVDDEMDSVSLDCEPAISSHLFNTAEYARRSFWIYLYIGGMAAFCLLLIVAGVSLLRRSPNVAYVVMGFSSVFLLIGYWLFHVHNQFHTQGVASIEVCPTGIRWLKSATDSPCTASWSQIANIEPHHESPYPWRHYLLLTLRAGDVFRLGGFSLTDYDTFAKNLSNGFLQHSANHAPPPTSGYQKLSTAGADGFAAEFMRSQEPATIDFTRIQSQTTALQMCSSITSLSCRT